MSPTIREEMLTRATDYVVINDGQVRYPVLRAKLSDGDTERRISEMSADEYADWCNSVPADARAAEIGSGEMIQLCDDLIASGAAHWHVA